MQVKRIAECSLQREHSAILSTFIKLPFVIKTYVLSIFEWPFYTGFTVKAYIKFNHNIKDADQIAAIAGWRCVRFVRHTKISDFFTTQLS